MNPLNTWVLSPQVTSLFGMFNNARKFNQDLNLWVVDNIETMENMFQNARKFDGDISIIGMFLKLKP